MKISWTFHLSEEKWDNLNKKPQDTSSGFCYVALSETLLKIEIVS